MLFAFCDRQAVPQMARESLFHFLVAGKGFRRGSGLSSRNSLTTGENDS